MLSRHFLRAKVLQTIYAYKSSSLDDVSAAGKNFSYNVEHLNELASLQLGCLRQYININRVIIEAGLKKMMPTWEEKNPSYRMVDNVFLNRLFENFDYRQHVDALKFPWEVNEEPFSTACTNIKQMPRYKEYMALTETDFENDKRMALDLFKFLMNDNGIRSIFQERSLWWDDDFDQVAQYNYSFLKDLKEDMDEATPLPLMHDERNLKDCDDYNFARTLLISTLRTFEKNESLIRSHLQNWEFERVALIDLIIINMAIVELTEYESIPERVTVDECIELAKEFSSDKSRIFINGILDKILIDLRMSGRINKSGRGLFVPDDNFNDDSNQ